jgi:hypothetical protein
MIEITAKPSKYEGKSIVSITVDTNLVSSFNDFSDSKVLMKYPKIDELLEVFDQDSINKNKKGKFYCDNDLLENLRSYLKSSQIQA